MANTIVKIQSSGQEIPLPGTTWTAETIKTALSASITGIGSMEVTQSAQDGDIVFTFSQRTGTKG